jgi:uncharacterized membrane protein YkoI
MKRRTLTLVAVIAAAAALVLVGATFALGGGSGTIWDDGHPAQPGSLDDGTDLLPQTTITLAQANAAAQRATSGALGQVDLERYAGKVVFKVDIGTKEVRVDAADGSIVTVGPQS